MSSHTRPQQNGSARANALTPINADGLSVSAYTLGIIYSLIARGNVILAHYACCHGNFSEVALQVIKNIELDTDGKLTYAAGEYMYHYICEGGIVYLCITDDDFERSKAFLFLDRIKQRFSEAYTENSIASALPFAMNSEFSGTLAKEMRYYTDTALSLLPSPNQVRLERIGVRDLELSDDEGDVERLQLLESGSSDVSFRSHDSTLSLARRDRGNCSDWLQQHWKALIIVLIVGLFITVVQVSEPRMQVVKGSEATPVHRGTSSQHNMDEVILVAAVVGVYIENEHG